MTPWGHFQLDSSTDISYIYSVVKPSLSFNLFCNFSDIYRCFSWWEFIIRNVPDLGNLRFLICDSHISSRFELFVNVEAVSPAPLWLLWRKNKEKVRLKWPMFSSKPASKLSIRPVVHQVARHGLLSDGRSTSERDLVVTMGRSAWKDVYIMATNSANPRSFNTWHCNNAQ